MDITFLVGNGFDLACGLPTKFSDFCTWYCKRDSQNEYIKKLKTDISGKLEHWSDFESALGQYTEKIGKNDAEAFLECHDDIISSMNEYLKEVVSKIDTENIIEKKLTELTLGIESFYFELPGKEKDFFEHAIATEKNQGNNINVHFISFNYTNVLDACIKKIATQNREKKITIDTSIVHVHGKLDETLILGVSDVSQLGNKELSQFFSFPEAMIKEQSVNATREYWYDNASKLIDRSNIICIFGMSFGKTDKYWWNKVMKWLSGSTQRYMILFSHALPPAALNARKKVVCDKKEKEQLCVYSDLDEKKKNEIEQRIYVIYRTKHVLQISFPENIAKIQKKLNEI